MKVFVEWKAREKMDIHERKELEQRYPAKSSVLCPSFLFLPSSQDTGFSCTHCLLPKVYALLPKMYYFRFGLRSYYCTLVMYRKLYIEYK